MFWKFSVLAGFMGRLKDRFIDYQPERDIDEILAMAARVRGCAGVEVTYPQHFADPRALKQRLEHHGLGVSAVNLNVKSEEKWRFGSFAGADPGVRAEAVAYMKAAMDEAAALGCDLVTSAFLNDGEDYPFEADMVAAFRDTIEGVRQAASHRADIRVALEYKASEPRVHCLVGNAGTGAYVASLTGCANVGVTLDVGHALQAQEIPAQSAALLGVTGKLFYVHVNDNYRNWDWDLVPGAVNLWDYLEFMLYLKRVGYQGWIAADVFPQRHDPVRVMTKTYEWMEYVCDVVDRIDERELAVGDGTRDAFDRLDYVRGLVGPMHSR